MCGIFRMCGKYVYIYNIYISYRTHILYGTYTYIYTPFHDHRRAKFPMGPESPKYIYLMEHTYIKHMCDMEHIYIHTFPRSPVCNTFQGPGESSAMRGSSVLVHCRTTLRSFRSTLAHLCVGVGVCVCVIEREREREGEREREKERALCVCVRESV